MWPRDHTRRLSGGRRRTGKVGAEAGRVKSSSPQPIRPRPGSDMKLRLFPQEPAGLVLLAQMASVIVAATGTLSEILGAQASEHERLTEELHEHESKSLDLHFALLTHMRTSFVNPLPREDMYTLSRHLNEAMEKLDAAGELVALYKLERLPKRAADQLEIISRQAELTALLAALQHGSHV